MTRQPVGFAPLTPPYNSPRKPIPRQILRHTLGAHHIILDANPAVGLEARNGVPVDAVALPFRLELVEQHVDEVEAGFDGDDHARLQNTGEAQVGMAVGLGDGAACV